MGRQTVVTNQLGIYRLPTIAPGIYTLQYEGPGFALLTRSGIEVSLG
jgi:hypothetical protein